MSTLFHRGFKPRRLLINFGVLATDEEAGKQKHQRNRGQCRQRISEHQAVERKMIFVEQMRANQSVPKSARLRTLTISEKPSPSLPAGVARRRGPSGPARPECSRSRSILRLPVRGPVEL